MRSLRFILAALLLPLSAFAQQGTGVGFPTVAAALDALKTRSGAHVSVQGGWTIVDETAAATIWSFTPPTHPAHPAVVKRTMVVRDGAVSIEMRALCQAGKEACDKLMDEFNALNARMGQAIRDKTAGAQSPRPSQVDVQDLGGGAFRFVLKSYRSKTPDAGQQELLPRIKEVCGERNIQLGKFEFETEEPVDPASSDAGFLALKQNVVCGGALNTTPPTATSADAGWHPTAAQAQSVERDTTAYFGAKDAGRYSAAYEQLSSGLKKTTSFEHWRAMAEDFSSKAGPVVDRRIRKVTWYRNPPQAEPGTYAAVDFSSRFANIDIHCGYLAWIEQADGSFRMVREEENFIDRAAEQKSTRQSLEKIRAQFGCRD